MYNSNNLNLNITVKFELNDFLGEINNKNYILYRDILLKSRIENDSNTFYNIFNDISSYTDESDFYEFMKFVLNKIYENDSIQHTKPINIVYPITEIIRYYH